MLRRVWKQAAADNVFFLAGGLAFSILLALVPFALLLIAGLSFFLGSETTQAADTVMALVARLLPDDAPSASDLLRGIVGDVLLTRGTVTIYAAVGFAWFSTRLFGSLRSVLAIIFDGDDHGIISGKLFDFFATIVATVVVVVYVVLAAYLDLATTRGVALLERFGIQEAAIGTVAYILGRALGVTVVFALFFALYRGLPRSRPDVPTTLIGATTAALLFEVARHLFGLFIVRWDPGSLYTGSIAVVVAVVFWTYYSALIFILGGEVAQAVGLRRAEHRAFDQAPGELSVMLPSKRPPPRKRSR